MTRPAKAILLLPLILPICMACQIIKNFDCNNVGDLEDEGYDKDMSPSSCGSDTVWVEVEFSKIRTLDTANHVLELEFWFIMKWKEPRIEFGSSCFNDNGNTSFSLHSDEIEDLWQPPMDIENVVKDVKGRQTMAKGSEVDNNIMKDGFIKTWKRYKAEIVCEMIFDKFPFDTQTCDFLFHIQEEDLKLDWLILSEKSTQKEATKLPGWRTELKTIQGSHIHNNRQAGITTMGLGVHIIFTRIYTFHLMQTVLPSTLIAMGSVLSVFVSSDLVPGRMGLCVTGFLSMVALFNGARDDWPKTATLKAIDYWCGVCYLIVFAVLVEYCVVLYLTKPVSGSKRD